MTYRGGTITRRRLLQEAAAAGALATLPASAAAARPRRPRRRPTVAVLGGGVGGLTAAHELAERGFRVTVFERRALGGKARSFGVPGSAAGARRPLPAEHGARFFPGFYANLPETMRRIPFGTNPNGTFDNLVTAPQGRYARSGGREDFNANSAPTEPYPWTLERFRESLVAALDIGTHVPPHEIAWFADRLLLFFASCDARRLGQWERMSWWEFTAAERFSEDYRRLLVSSATRLILGSKASEASARTLGLLWEGAVYNLMGRGSNGSFDRVLDAPTNEAFVAPWVRHLRRLGVGFRMGAEVERIQVDAGRVRGIVVRTRRGRERVEADWVVCALPVERARRLWSPRVLTADPGLARTRGLETRWMNGLQFYLHEPVPIVHGHVLYIDSPWALSSISQAQFWPRGFADRYGDGSAQDCLSVDIADFDVPGVVYGKPARELGPKQIAREVWQQMKDHLNDTGRPLLRDDMVASWYLDPALVWSRGTVRNEDPLFISTPGAWENRPDARTRIPNLTLAADYVRVNIDTACMEGANEAGRRAANAVLEESGSREQPAAVFDLYKPPEFEPLRSADEQLWARGAPNPLDAPV
jgi:uncharacterized protein with NAD-binding domain and iron-sulfur cluster